LFDLFRDDGGNGSDRSAASLDVTPASTQYDTKYYTPFGSGVSLGDLTRREPGARSCWNTEASESHNRVIGKSLPMTSITNKKFSPDKFDAGMKLSDIGIKVASKRVEGLSTTTFVGHPLVMARSDSNSLLQMQNGQQRDALVYESLSGNVSNHRAAKPPSPKLMGIPGDSKCSDAEQREKQIVATQQLFMRELNRLPPDLRKQYVDYMFASRLGIQPGASPTIPAVPGVYYNVAVGPGAVPITQLFGPPVILPAGLIMPTPLITFQPLVPSTVTKTVSR